ISDEKHEIGIVQTACGPEGFRNFTRSTKSFAGRIQKQIDFRFIGDALNAKLRWRREMGWQRREHESGLILRNYPAALLHFHFDWVARIGFDQNSESSRAITEKLPA